jgi:hypothetical protein
MILEIHSWVKVNRPFVFIHVVIKNKNIPFYILLCRIMLSFVLEISDFECCNRDSLAMLICTIIKSKSANLFPFIERH